MAVLSLLLPSSAHLCSIQSISHLIGDFNKQSLYRAAHVFFIASMFVSVGVMFMKCGCGRCVVVLCEVCVVTMALCEVWKCSLFILDVLFPSAIAGGMGEGLTRLPGVSEVD